MASEEEGGGGAGKGQRKLPEMLAVKRDRSSAAPGPTPGGDAGRPVCEKAKGTARILNFGQRMLKKCHSCQIAYCAASKEDAREHGRIHRKLAQRRGSAAFPIPAQWRAPQDSDQSPGSAPGGRDKGSRARGGGDGG